MLDYILEFARHYPIVFIIIVLIVFVGNVRAVYWALRKFGKK
jgi:hypothetical protein